LICELFDIQQYEGTDFRSWVWVIENRKHKNLSTFFKHRESARFSELINDLWTRPNFDASFWIYRHYAGDIFRNLIFCTTIKVKVLYKYSTSSTGAKNHLSPLRFQTFNRKVFWNRNEAKWFLDPVGEVL